MRRGINAAVRRFIRTSRLSRAAQSTSAVRDLALSYFAGELVTDAVFCAEDLRRKGLSVSFSHLALSDDELETPDELAKLLTALDGHAAGSEISVKPSSLGLRRDPSRAESNLRHLCDRAVDAGAHVTLEMQAPADFDDTVALFRRVRADVGTLGITLPVNLRRAAVVLPELARDGNRVRICVGSYPAPMGAGLRGEHRKSMAMARFLRVLMASDAYPIVASHDPRIIEIAEQLAARNGRGGADFEFQMLMGVRPLEQRRLVDIGHTCRTYIPFGPAWYEYLATRIAARPRILWNYSRAILDKR